MYLSFFLYLNINIEIQMRKRVKLEILTAFRSAIRYH